MCNDTFTYRSRGFTLVEILAALLFIGLILPAAMKGVSLASTLASASARKYEAMGLAETKLAEVIVEEDWQSGGTGKFEEPFDEYEWTLDVSQSGAVAGLKEIDLIVFWQQRNRRREVTLSTYIYENQE